VVTHAILDTPAGFSGKALESVVKVSSSIIVPIQPSPFDLWATKQFLEQLAELKAVNRGKAGVVLIGMRVGHPARQSTELKPTGGESCRFTGRSP